MNPDPEDPDTLLALLSVDPQNTTLRERTARALRDAARPSEAFEVLRTTLTHLTAHDNPLGPAPCLCFKCIQPGLDTVHLGTLSLRRDFVVAHGRVLYFWSPESLGADSASAREAVRARMLQRLGKGPAPDPRRV